MVYTNGLCREDKNGMKESEWGEDERREKKTSKKEENGSLSHSLLSSV